MKPRYVQISALSVEDQLRAKQHLGVRDPPSESDRLWCGHLKSGIIRVDAKTGRELRKPAKDDKEAGKEANYALKLAYEAGIDTCGECNDECNND